MHVKFAMLLIIIFYDSINPLFNSKYKRIPENEISDIFIRYDPNCLRIPGNKLPIGITTLLKNGKIAETRGYLNGNIKWNSFRFEVEGGQFSYGNVIIGNHEEFLKDKGITVSVYTRKSGDLIKSFFIPYNYEESVELITKEDFKRALGSKTSIGLKKTYNNLKSEEIWFRYNDEIKKDFAFQVNGGYIKNGTLHIYQDPFEIENHEVKLKIWLLKNSSISDSLSFRLDYRDKYTYATSGSSGFWGSDGSNGSSGSSGGGDGSDGSNGENGENGSDGSLLHVYADVYFDTLINEQLMYIEITPENKKNKKKYLINTDGGSIRITNYGGNGGDGGDGGNGGNGGNGNNGEKIVEVIQVNDSTTMEQTSLTEGERGGNGGYGGDGGDGGNGGNGGDILIYYTSYAAEFLHLINAKSLGGKGGTGGSAGNAGNAGSGGNGDPNGLEGSIGKSGISGYNGLNGYNGNVEFILVE